ncbi:uncharacterized protein LOC136092599 isoform X1 [Hydra vulgaris]|uniref:uncharacterized protein LOC136092599 isoform X1 n=1 Tax=Hydra vulgaris TaxID=6087 RepID=UPI0032EA49FB
MSFIFKIKQLSLIGDKNLADTIKNILLLLPTDTNFFRIQHELSKEEKKFKELTSLCNAVTEAALKSNKNLTKMDAIQLIGRVVRHSSDRIKKTSTNMDFDQCWLN